MAARRASKEAVAGAVAVAAAEAGRAGNGGDVMPPRPSPGTQSCQARCTHLLAGLPDLMISDTHLPHFLFLKPRCCLAM